MHKLFPNVQGTGNREIFLKWSNYIPRDNYRLIRKISAFYHLPLAISNHYSQSYWNQKHLKFRSSLHSLNLQFHIWDFMLNHIWFCYREIPQWVYMNYSQTCIKRTLCMKQRLNFQCPEYNPHESYNKNRYIKWTPLLSRRGHPNWS